MKSLFTLSILSISIALSFGFSLRTKEEVYKILQDHRKGKPHLDQNLKEVANIKEVQEVSNVKDQEVLVVKAQEIFNVKAQEVVPFKELRKSSQAPSPSPSPSPVSIDIVIPSHLSKNGTIVQTSPSSSISTPSATRSSQKIVPSSEPLLESSRGEEEIDEESSVEEESGEYEDFRWINCNYLSMKNLIKVSI